MIGDLCIIDSALIGFNNFFEMMYGIMKGWYVIFVLNGAYIGCMHVSSPIWETFSLTQSQIHAHYQRLCIAHSMFVRNYFYNWDFGLAGIVFTLDSLPNKETLLVLLIWEIVGLCLWTRFEAEIGWHPESLNRIW